MLGSDTMEQPESELIYVHQPPAGHETYGVSFCQWHVVLLSEISEFGELNLTVVLRPMDLWLSSTNCKLL